MAESGSDFRAFVNRQMVPLVVAIIGFALAFVWVGRVEYGGGFGWAAFFATPLCLGLLAGLARSDEPVKYSVLWSFICLVLVAPVMGEGLVCIVVLGPMFLLIAMLTALMTGLIARRTHSPAKYALLLLPPALFALEKRPLPSELPTATVSDEVIINAPPDVAWASIDQLGLRFDGAMPWFVRELMPKPVAIWGSGASVGSVRRVEFENGTVVANVVESEWPRRFRMSLGYESPGREFFDHWTDLKDTEFEFHALPDGRTRLVHTTRYTRKIFPAWYFEPVEQFGAHLIQKYMLDHYAEYFEHGGARPQLVAQQ